MSTSPETQNIIFEDIQGHRWFISKGTGDLLTTQSDLEGRKIGEYYVCLSKVWLDKLKNKEIEYQLTYESFIGGERCVNFELDEDCGKFSTFCIANLHFKKECMEFSRKIKEYIDSESVKTESPNHDSNTEK